MNSQTEPVRLRILSVTGLFLFLMFVECGADDTVEPFTRTVSKNAMWIAGLASGLGLLGLAMIVLMISTIFIRRYEKTRLQEMLSMAPLTISVVPKEEPRQPGFGSGSQPLSMLISPGANQGPTSEADTHTSGHVYYNRALDIDEVPEENRSHITIANRKPEISVC